MPSSFSKLLLIVLLVTQAWGVSGRVVSVFVGPCEAHRRAASSHTCGNHLRVCSRETRGDHDHRHDAHARDPRVPADGPKLGYPDCGCYVHVPLPDSGLPRLTVGDGHHFRATFVMVALSVIEPATPAAANASLRGRSPSPPCLAQVRALKATRLLV